eukprot:TRINITY_DN5657_c0_g2_i3.p1 TRINITY_DN5657_c0_g2~~TRINITY_DN5657_c0_g2_i3.p1  ORF type:complete len:696 (-),score=172.25 TRINITY_DN5657_c0_g2_i3:69-2156(-)
MGPDFKMSLNDVCCFLPCWGGAASTFLVGMLTLQSTGSTAASVISAAVMAIIPGHIMRSVGGGYDNECIAMASMLLTFNLWVLSLRSKKSWPIGIFAGLAYGNMVAAWGGYIFVINMVALHAAWCLVFDFMRNKYSTRLYKAYTCFFIVGTAIAVCVPPVGWAPFKSLEQLFAFLVFIFMQVLQYTEGIRRKEGVDVRSARGVGIKLRGCMMTLGVLCAIIAVLTPTGFFGPLSSRVRGLFVQHTRTGNPLVDSVAEHQPANSGAYWQYFHFCSFGWTMGTPVFLFMFRSYRSAHFIILYSFAAFYFCTRMARLILLAAPVVSVCTGAVVGLAFEWALRQLLFPNRRYLEDIGEPICEPIMDTQPTKGGRGRGNRQQEKSVTEMIEISRVWYFKHQSLRHAVSGAILLICVAVLPTLWEGFAAHSENMAWAFSSPKVVFASQVGGREVIIRDYVEAYHWLRDNTPEDARVMAWWDYGYQITGIGNRTTIADGNTWNHEHIATLGKCLTSPVKEAHTLVRHLADYVLVRAGGRGDDLMKSPHMARIGNSVYRDICPNDPMCRQFGFMSSDFSKPTPMMNASLLYNLHSHNMRGGVRVDDKLFKHVYDSKHRLVRIFKVENVSQESKDWVADPANRKCNPPGSWQCPGQYPPASPIQKLLKKRIDFAQIEDFNLKKSRKGRNDGYVEKYLRAFGGQA